jgi:flagellar biosynthesis regulator FlaF
VRRNIAVPHLGMRASVLSLTVFMLHECKSRQRNQSQR